MMPSVFLLRDVGIARTSPVRSFDPPPTPRRTLMHKLLMVPIIALGLAMTGCEQAREKTEEMAEKAKEMSHEMAERSKQAYQDTAEKTKDLYHEAAEKTREMARDASEATQHAWDKTKEKYEEVTGDHEESETSTD
jgi:hypothetical protein